MKKNSLKRAFTAVAATALALTASSVSAFAALENNGMEYNLTPKDGSASELKPTLEVTKVVGKASELAGKNVTVEFKVSGVDGKYATTGYHIYWDDRLAVVPAKTGAYAKKGEALADVDATKAENNGANGVFVACSSSADYGYDGVMWTVEFTVPADAQAGDVFPIDVAYEIDNESGTGDLFTQNKPNTDTAKLMQAYFFTQGINNQASDPYLVKAGATFAEGYIALEEETTTTTTTTSATTTTTSASTTSGTGTSSSTTAQTTTTKKGSGSGSKTTDSPKTGVTGVGVAVAGLAVAVGTAFALKKKED